MIDWIVSWFGGTGETIYETVVSSPLAAVGAWMKETLVWFFGLMWDWMQEASTDWFLYVINLVDPASQPQIAWLVNYVLVWNGYVPLDLGFQLWTMLLGAQLAVAAIKWTRFLLPL